jgi:hypothetical protein
MNVIQLTKKYLDEQIEMVDSELDYLITQLDNGKIKEDNTLLVRAYTRLSLFKAVYNQIKTLEAENNGV